MTLAPSLPCPGIAPKDKVFESYINMERQLGYTDRCRTLYGLYLEFRPSNCSAWLQFAAMEAAAGEIERARSIYELGISQPVLDTPEVLWKAFIGKGMAVFV